MAFGDALLWRVIAGNFRTHPVTLGLLYLYCPAAVYWWRAGVEVTAPPIDPVCQAMQDYTAQPPRTMREFLEEYGVASLADDFRKYIEQVKTARQRLPHIKAPELLPTFPGGKLPLRRRFGIQQELKRFGGADGLFEYVRTWAFLVDDWKAGIPLAMGAQFRAIRVVVRLDGMRRPYSLPAWSLHVGGREDPDALCVFDGTPTVLRALYLLAQTAGERAWHTAPQVWLLRRDGTAPPLDPPAPIDQQAQALLKAAQLAKQTEAPFPAAALVSPKQCETCPFRSLCYNDRREWTPQVVGAIGASTAVQEELLT